VTERTIPVHITEYFGTAIAERDATIIELRKELAAARELQRSIFAWAKAARTKGSGLPPTRALRWIDELGDRIALSRVEQSDG
jgi:hypothetical protein